MQVFNASCPSGQVILMKSARYGRMKLGDCLTTDIFIGCSDDILPQLDQRCSGRRQCEIKLPDQTLHEKLSCPKDLMAYLEAEYSCVQGNMSCFHVIFTKKNGTWSYEIFRGKCLVNAIQFARCLLIFQKLKCFPSSFTARNYVFISCTNIYCTLIEV